MRTVKAAALGDEAAFMRLVEQSRARIHGMISSFVSPTLGLEREDAFQIAVTAMWRSVRSGRLNASADVYAQASVAIRHRLITEAERLRAECRYNGGRDVPLDALGPDDPLWLDPSWASYADPARVVLAREELRRCWALTTERQRQAIERWLGGDTSKPTTDALTLVRRKVRPMLASPLGVHPTLQVDRRCRHCGGALTGDIRATVHAGCRNRYEWQRELLARPLRLV